MRVVPFAPDERLAPFVRDIRVVETDVETTRALIPETGVLLAFRYSGSARDLRAGPTPIPDAAITGLHRTARRMCTSPGGGVVVVAFREAGAVPFLSEPLHHLFGHTIALEHVAPRPYIDRTLERVTRARDARERVRVVQDFLLERLRPDRADALVTHAVRMLHATHGSMRVEDVARRLEISRDRLEKRFRQQIGASPKSFATIVRLRRSIELYRDGTNLAELSVAAGYFDQSHFIRDFRAFTGEAPGRFFRSQEHC